MRKIVLLLLELAVAGSLAACAGVGRVPPVAIEPAAPRTSEPGKYAAIVQSREWVLSTASGPYDCGPLGVYVDANGSYQDAMRAVLSGTLQNVTFVSNTLTPEEMKNQGFDAQIVVSQGSADADLVGLPLPGGTARSDVSLAVTVAVRDQHGAVAQKTVVGYGRGKGEGADCRQIVAAIGDAAQTAISTIARQSATYVAAALRDRRVARTASPAPQPAPPPPKPVAQAEPPKREAPESIQDTVRGAMAGAAVAIGPTEAIRSAQVESHAEPGGATKAPDSKAATHPDEGNAGVSGSAGTPPERMGSTTADGAGDARGGSSDAPLPAPDVPDVSDPQPGDAPLHVSNDDAPQQRDASDEDQAKAAPVERPPGTETVAMATPRITPPSPPSGSITAEEAFVRGADAAAGRGVPKSDAEAIKWYRIAAAKGYAPAQNNLGFMYAEGRGVPRDDAEAVKWYKRAAAQKYPPAETGLGMMYVAGRGVKQSDFEALALYSSAANQGYGQAKANLAAMFGEGRGVRRDIMTATFLLGSVRERPYTGSGIYVEPSMEKREQDAPPGQSSATNTSAYRGQ